MKKLIVFAVLLLPMALAYQQVYLVFDLPGWDVVEQRSTAQLFQKGDMYLQVKASTSDVLNSSEIARTTGGELVSSETVGDVEETVVELDDRVLIFGMLPREEETYILTLNAPSGETSAAQSEMRKIYDTFEIADEPSVVEAPWEEELKKPERLSLLEKNPIPWGWVVFWLLVAGLVYWKWGKKFLKKE